MVERRPRAAIGGRRQARGAVVEGFTATSCSPGSKRGGESAGRCGPGSPRLKAEPTAFLQKHGGRRKTFGATLFKQYFEQHAIRERGRAAAERKKFDRTVELFRKYGDSTTRLPADGGAGLSGVAPRSDVRRATVGAIGVMQVMPATGKELKVGDITARAEHPRRREVHALHDRPVLRDEPMDPAEQGALRVRLLQRRPGRIASCGGRRRSAGSIPTSGSTTSSRRLARRSAARRSPTWRTSTSTTWPTATSPRTRRSGGARWRPPGASAVSGELSDRSRKPQSGPKRDVEYGHGRGADSLEHRRLARGSQFRSGGRDWRLLLIVAP